jgi:Protein of unknown function (DUF2924)
LTDTVLTRVAALKTMPILQLKQQWRELYETDPPPFNRRYLESRIAYRIQELAYGGLKPDTIQRLQALADELEEGGSTPRGRAKGRPIAGTQLVREWQGVEHRVTVTEGGFLHEGTPYKSLSAISRAITGTRWNGWVFFGIKRQGTRA